MFDADGLRSFQNLCDIYNLPGNTFFFYLQLRASMRAHGVPWQTALAMHPFHRIIRDVVDSRSQGLSPHYTISCWISIMGPYLLTLYGGMIFRIWILTSAGTRSGLTSGSLPETQTINKFT